MDVRQHVIKCDSRYKVIKVYVRRRPTGDYVVTESMRHTSDFNDPVVQVGVDWESWQEERAQLLAAHQLEMGRRETKLADAAQREEVARSAQKLAEANLVREKAALEKVTTEKSVVDNELKAMTRRYQESEKERLQARSELVATAKNLESSEATNRRVSESLVARSSPKQEEDRETAQDMDGLRRQHAMHLQEQEERHQAFVADIQKVTKEEIFLVCAHRNQLIEENATLKEQAVGLRAEIAAAETERQRLVADQQRLQREQQRLNEQVADSEHMRERFDEVQREHKQAMADISRFQANYKERDSREAELRDKAARCEELEVRAEGMQAEIAPLLESNRKKKETIKDLKEQIIELTKEFAEKVKHNKQLSGAMILFDAVVDQHKRELSKLAEQKRKNWKCCNCTAATGRELNAKVLQLEHEKKQHWKCNLCYKQLIKEEVITPPRPPQHPPTPPRAPTPELSMQQVNDMLADMTRNVLPEETGEQAAPSAAAGAASSTGPSVLASSAGAGARPSTRPSQVFSSGLHGFGQFPMETERFGRSPHPSEEDIFGQEPSDAGTSNAGEDPVLEPDYDPLDPDYVPTGGESLSPTLPTMGEEVPLPQQPALFSQEVSDDEPPMGSRDVRHRLRRRTYSKRKQDVPKRYERQPASSPTVASATAGASVDLRTATLIALSSSTSPETPGGTAIGAPAARVSSTTTSTDSNRPATKKAKGNDGSPTKKEPQKKKSEASPCAPPAAARRRTPSDSDSDPAGMGGLGRDFSAPVRTPSVRSQAHGSGDKESEAQGATTGGGTKGKKKTRMNDPPERSHRGRSAKEIASAGDSLRATQQTVTAGLRATAFNLNACRAILEGHHDDFADVTTLDCSYQESMARGELLFVPHVYDEETRVIRDSACGFTQPADWKAHDRTRMRHVTGWHQHLMWFKKKKDGRYDLVGHSCYAKMQEGVKMRKPADLAKYTFYNNRYDQRDCTNPITPRHGYIYLHFATRHKRLLRNDQCKVKEFILLRTFNDAFTLHRYLNCGVYQFYMEVQSTNAVETACKERLPHPDVHAPTCHLLGGGTASATGEGGGRPEGDDGEGDNAHDADKSRGVTEEEGGAEGEARGHLEDTDSPVEDVDDNVDVASEYHTSEDGHCRNTGGSDTDTDVLSDSNIASKWIEPDRESSPLLPTVRKREVVMADDFVDMHFSPVYY